MKPHRIRMTHNLLLNYGLYKKMEIYVREHTTRLLFAPLTPPCPRSPRRFPHTRTHTRTHTHTHARSHCNGPRGSSGQSDKRGRQGGRAAASLVCLANVQPTLPLVVVSFLFRVLLPLPRGAIRPRISSGLPALRLWETLRFLARPQRVEFPCPLGPCLFSSSPLFVPHSHCAGRVLTPHPLSLSLSSHPLAPLPRTSQRPERAVEDDMTKYHSDEYVNFLKTITPDNVTENAKQMSRCRFLTGLEQEELLVTALDGRRS